MDHEQLRATLPRRLALGRLKLSTLYPDGIIGKALATREDSSGKPWPTSEWPTERQENGLKRPIIFEVDKVAAREVKMEVK